MRPRKLTRDEYDAIRRMRAEGVKNLDIAKALNRSHGAIDLAVAKMELPKRNRPTDEVVSQVVEMRMKGVLNKVICRRLGISDTIIETIVRKRQLPKRRQRRKELVA